MSTIRLLLVILFFVFINQRTFAQKDALAKDSLVYHKLLLVPFDPMMYLSDAEQDILEQSEKKAEDYRNYMRKSLDNKIAAEVEQIIPCYSLLGARTEAALESTGEIYGQCNFDYAEPMKLKQTKSIKQNTSSGNSKKTLDSKVAPQYITVQGDAKYMNATIKNKELFEKLNKQYGADLFLLINQFEIKTNYNNCIDISRHVYKREVIVSYSIYNSKGVQVDGNLAHTYFPSDTSRDSDIAERTFPQIAEIIASHVKVLALTR